MLDFSRLGTPTEHGDVLIQPSMNRLLDLARTNHDLLSSYDFDVVDLHVQTVRTRLRDQVCEGCTGPIVMTGHQPEFIHAGVWAKHIAASKLAAAMHAKTVNLVVDSDEAKHTSLAVPRRVGSNIEWTSIPYAHTRRGVPYEDIARLDDRACEQLEAGVRDWMGEMFETSAMPRYFDALSKASDAGDWVDQMIFARRAVERSFGIDMIEHRVAKMWFGPLLGDLIQSAERFAACYNDAIAEYRATYGVRSPNRPVPDLVCDDGRIELPLWLHKPGQPRRRMFVEPGSDRVTVYADAERIGQVSSGELGRWDLASQALQNMSGYAYRPRALSLTLWARVFVGDLFIHGIGGAKYDRITDGIIRRYYNVDPPAMGCVSATMWIDPQGGGSSPDSDADARNRYRDVLFNPQRHVERKADTAELIAARENAAAESIELRANRPKDKSRRRQVFQRIRSLNEQIVRSSPDMRACAERALEQVRTQVSARQASRQREFFFAMLDCSSLQMLCDKFAT
jgi:hypothetical protein